MFTQSIISLVALSAVLLPTALAAPGPAWIRRQENAQSSLTLDPATISEGLKQDGQGANPDPGQVRSLTSSNNFINFCLGPLANGVPLTNGKQIATGSCNQTPMGRIISLDKAPRSKFVFPKNGDESLEENTAFTVRMKILNMQTGNFVNAAANYYASPQQVNGQGIVIGHSHVVIERLPSLQTTEPLDPTKFDFFKGLNNVAANDILTADVSSGLKAGVYRICSINTAANHQPCVVSNAQRGSLDDCSYFTVKAKGAGNNVNASTSSASASATSTSVSATASVTASVNNSQSASVSSASVTASVSSASVTASVSESSSASATASSSASSASQTASASESSASPDSSSTASSSAVQPTSTNESSSAVESSSADPSSTTAPEAAPSQGNNQGNQGNNQDNQGNNQPSPSSAEASPSAEPSSAPPAPSAEPSSSAAEQSSSPIGAPSSSADPAPSPSGAPEAAPSQGNNQANQGNNQDPNQSQSQGN